nr:immunoglobulin heavy chain junction region [Mus musculus]
CARYGGLLFYFDYW